jgi:peptidoglycan/LPS O-acetylase OafA/YrhL
MISIMGNGIESTTARGRMAKENSFNSLRLFGSLIVLWGHAFIITGGVAPVIGGIPIHSFGVCIFFVISGYLITQSWISDPDVFRYILRRALRIFPGLLLVLVATAFIIGPFATTEPMGQYFHHGWTYRYVLSNALLMTVWSLPATFIGMPVTGQANGSLWTLPIEFSLYLVTPLLVLCKKGLGYAGVVLVLIVSVTIILAKNTYPQIFTFNLAGVDFGKGLALSPFFLIGSGLRLAKFEEWPQTVARFSIVASVIAVVAWLLFERSDFSILAIAIVPISILILAVGRSSLLHSVSLDKIGDVSYGTYLWAFPVQQLVMNKFGGGAYFNLAVAGPLIFGLAYASWHWVESPALRFKPKRRLRGARVSDPNIPAMARLLPGLAALRHDDALGTSHPTLAPQVAD